MNFLASLAQARLALSREKFAEIVGMPCEPAPDGTIESGFRFGARISIEGQIGEIWFGYMFPSNIFIDGLHIGMGLDALLATSRGFDLRPTRILVFYEASGESGERIKVEIRDNRIWQLTFAWPQAVYPTGRSIGFRQLPSSLCCYKAPCDLLFDWAYSFTFTDNKDWAPKVAEWLLRDAGPDGWHVAVSDWNWDDGAEPLLWIARQPECDKATALKIFFWSRPGQMLEFSSPGEVRNSSLDVCNVVTEIRDRFVSGFYTRSEIAFDGTNAFANEAYLPSDPDLQALERWIPQAMREDIAGRPEPRSAPECPI